MKKAENHFLVENLDKWHCVVRKGVAVGLLCKVVEKSLKNCIRAKKLFSNKKIFRNQNDKKKLNIYVKSL